jgi:DNA-binding transcriptional regulator YiaG
MKPINVEQWQELEVHELATIFPMMSPEDFATLLESVRKQGFLPSEPIVLLDGKILDGRNRRDACRVLAQKGELNGTPTFVEFNGTGNPTDWVVGKNLARRHLSTSQRAAIAAELAERLKTTTDKETPAQLTLEPAGVANLRQKKGRSSERAAEALNVSPRAVQMAEAVKAADPKLHKEVKAGKLSTNAALNKVNNAKKAAATTPRVTSRSRPDAIEVDSRLATSAAKLAKFYTPEEWGKIVLLVSRVHPTK